MRTFTAMRTLAIDYGMRRVGVALSDPTGFLASALTVIQRQNDGQVVEEVQRIVQEREVEQIVVGNPITMKGEVGYRAESVHQFVRLLEQAVDVPVTLYDERLTTVSAERVLIEADMSRKKRKGVVDAVAATILLQSFLDHCAR